MRLLLVVLALLCLAGQASAGGFGVQRQVFAQPGYGGCGVQAQAFVQPQMMYAQPVLQQQFYAQPVLQAQVGYGVGANVGFVGGAVIGPQTTIIRERRGLFGLRRSQTVIVR